MEKELLYNELYEKTQDCGRAQFVRLLMEKERENQELKSKLEASEKARKEAIDKLKKWGEEPDYDMYMKIKEYKEHKEILKILDIDKGEIKNL